MKRDTILIIILSITSTQLFANDYTEKTNLLHQEIAAHNTPNLTESTHPIIYNMVKELSIKANVSLPQYITTYSAEYFHVSESGRVCKKNNTIGVSVNILGDLDICRELLINLSYEEIEGLMAVAIATKAVHRVKKLAFSGMSATGLAIVGIYLFNKHYNLELSSAVLDLYEDHKKEINHLKLMYGLAYSAITPALLGALLQDNYLQKSIDFKAIELTDCKNVINGIKGIARVTDSYATEGLLSRISHALRLTSLFNMLVYPVRPFTDQERIAYLEKSLR